MVRIRLAAKKRLPAACILFLLVAGVAACKAPPPVGNRASAAAPKRSPIKKLFSGVAVPARVRSLEDVGIAADKTNLALAWISKSAGVDSLVSVAVFDASGKKTGEAEVAQDPGVVHSPGAGFDGGGNIVVSWRVAKDRLLDVPGGGAGSRQVDDLYIARVGKAGWLLTPARLVAQGVSNLGWRGAGSGWDKIITEADGGFRIAWYSSNNYRLEGEKLVPLYLGGGDSTFAGRAVVVAGEDWAVYQGEPSVRYQKFKVDSGADGAAVDVPVGTRPAPPGAREPLRHVEAIDADRAGNVYSLMQEETGPGKAIKSQGGAKTIAAIPAEVTLSRTDANLQPVIGALKVADSAINASGSERPSPWLSVSDDVISAVWPKARSRSETTHWLRQYTLEGMVTGPEIEVRRGFDPGLQAAVLDKLAVARSGGADLLVEFFSTGSWLYDFKIAGANQGRISSFEDSLIAVWLAAGAKDEELQVGRWQIR